MAYPELRLINYAKKCYEATGINVPAFNCANGVLIPEQGNTPATNRNATQCNRPDVLNGVCDPGSRFQVLPGRTANAVAVALCRKSGLPIAGNKYDDIAVIQHNKKNGATCFYQALGNLPGKVPAPKAVKIVGKQAWQSKGNGWLSPAETEMIGCTGCHDSGAFIRSPYLTQLTKPPHTLPNTADGFNNLDTPLKYVGLDYTQNRSWSIKLTNPNASDRSCVACHRLATSSISKSEGSAAILAVISTQPMQDSKNPHSLNSPIWMAPNQRVFSSVALESAKKYQKYAADFHALNDSILLTSPNLT